MNPQPPQYDNVQRPLGRTSFQVPTEASLARSQPGNLQRAISNSPTRSLQGSTKQGSYNKLQNQSGARTFGLRDRKALRPSLASYSSLRLDKISPSRRSSGLQAFAVPPRRVSRRILPSDLSFQTPSVAQETGPRNGLPDSPDDQLESELSIVTGEADSHKDLGQTALHEGFEEPDLPPTPTQLGLERTPARPRRLLSSSPTTQRGVWGKRRHTDHQEQSPSKLRSVHHGVGDKDLPGASLDMSQSLFPVPVLMTRKVKEQLSMDIQQLNDEIAELENWSMSSSRHTDNTGWEMGRLVSLLAEKSSHVTSATPGSHDEPISSLISTLLPFSAKSLRITPEEVFPMNPFALSELSHAESYLTIFAPLTLKAYSDTYCGLEPGIHLERRTLELSPPPPIPSTLLDISINYEVNLGTQSILSISAPLDGDKKVPVYLRQWVDSRLANPLLKLDLSGLCWGINRYWEATISRARLWSRLESQCQGRMTSHGGTVELGDYENSNAQILTTLDLRKILPHLERTSMLFESRGEDALRIYLSCELALDEWAGEPRLVPTISISAPSKIDGSSGKKIEQDARRLFHAILSEKRSDQIGADIEIDANTIVQATECVLGAFVCIDLDKNASKGKIKG